MVLGQEESLALVVVLVEVPGAVYAGPPVAVATPEGGAGLVAVAAGEDTPLPVTGDLLVSTAPALVAAVLGTVSKAIRQAPPSRS